MRPIAHRYAVLVCGVTLALLLASGASEMYFSYRESRGHIAALQAAQAEGAAHEIALYLRTVERGLTDVAKLPWGQPGYGPAQRREEFYRLMQLEPAITDLQVVDLAGREHLYVSRREDDREESLAEFDDRPLLAVSAKTPVLYGTTFFRDGLSPTLRVAVFDGIGAVVDTVDLRLLGEIVSRLRVGKGGLAYIVDAHNLLIAHPQPTEVLRRLNLSEFQAVRVARHTTWAAQPTLSLGEAVDLQGRPVIATAARVEEPDWLVFVEQPQAEALSPALATLTRTLLLIGLGGCVALAAGIWFARRMAAPIVALRRATQRIAGGDLTSPIQVESGDEIEALAQDFNLMAGHLQASYAGLEAKVAERTAQLSAALDDLAARKEEAERANTAKTRFLATASHDLRQPMHSISLLVGVLRDRLADAQQIMLADKVQASVGTMEELFGSLLDISKLDAGGVHPQVDNVDLGLLLSRAAQTWAPQAAERGLMLRVRPTSQVARSDAVLLERCLSNLVSNAIRYTRQGGVLVACRQRGNTACLQVWDTGPGIAAEHRGAIFEEFFRIDAPGTGAAKGLGLGLSIVQRSAQILGHGLRVESRLGRGSLFEIQLPCAVWQAAPWAAADALSVAAENNMAADQAALEGAFVVVTDDDDDNRQALVNALVHWRCHVLAAASCDEAVSRSAEHLRVPDLIISDYQLAQGRDGFEVIEQLRLRHGEPLPALLVTAHTDSELQTRATQAGVRLLHKPIGTLRLLRALREALATQPMSE